MITVRNTRFGTIEVDESTVLRFDNGLVGFPEETEFVLLERTEGKMVAFLQSVRNPALAFPIVDGSELPNYPDPSVSTLAQRAGLTGSEFGLLVIVAAKTSTKQLEANLLAPIVVDMESRRSAQVVLDARKFSAAHPLASTSKPDPLAEAKARIAEIRARSRRRSAASA